MKVGFTGTRNGMTEAQRIRVEELIRELDPDEFHHGDCVGSDEQAHWIVDEYNLEERSKGEENTTEVVIHPPIIQRLRAYCCGTANTRVTVLPEKPYLDRNADIVKALDTKGDVLIATPKEDKEVLRSGTWSTIRRAKKTGREVRIVLPSGEVIYP